VAEDDDQRRGVDVLRARVSIGPGTLQAVFEPGFRPTVIPPRQRPGVVLDTRVRGDTRHAWALKFDIEGGAVDGSVSYYDGRERLPDLTPLGLAGSALQIGQVYPHVRALGADFAATFAGTVLRGELAWQDPPDRTTDSPFVRHRQLYAVLGIERSWPGDLTLYAQLFGKRVIGFSDPANLADPRLVALARAGLAISDQASAERHGISLKATKKWSEAVSAELTVIAAWPQRDSIWRPRLIYRPDGHWRWVAGADWFRGPATSPFGQLRDNSRASVSAELFF
jgi:murein DD-endopeptidase MepM/ murein hydrolase activator NlpD